MSFLRHIGKIGDRKVAIVFREIPGEPHMALVTYTESLNRHLHDPMMACIESDIGQNSQNLADALNRTHTQDGKYILQVLHAEGLLKKVQSSQVIVTPNSNTKIKLDELNKILTEMEQGENAVKKLAELDKSRGIQDPAEVARKMRAEKTAPPVNVSAADGILGDSVLANNLLAQAQRMSAEAKGLLAESARLEQQANEMLGIPVATQTTEPVKRGRGRPAGAKSKAKATV
jgi:hypothetical protein